MADKKEQPKSRIDELLALITSGTATALQKKEFAELLSKAVEEEAENEKASKVTLIDDFIVENGLTIEEYIKMKKPAPSTEVIWEWTDSTGKVHQKIKGSKGKWASTETVKNSLTLAVALEHAKNAEGKSYIQKLYAPPKAK